MNLESLLLSTLAPWRDAPVWRVAFSGGLDSTVLLHALQRLRQQHALPDLQAIHVNHGLQAASDHWAAHCQQQCVAWGVPLVVLRVQVEFGASLEQAARDARYRAFSQTQQLNDLLLLAQHQDDQAETLLLRLLRGSGLRGLAAMPAERELGLGRLFRPLLDVPRQRLLEYAERWSLNWIEDPSNSDERFSRNFLRAQVLPLLRQRWPQSVAVMARASQHLQEAQGLLDELGEADLALAESRSAWSWLPWPSLALEALLTLSEARQRNALRRWLGGKVRALPDQAHWAGWQSLRDAAGDGDPHWQLAGGTLRRGAGHIWWLADQPAWQCGDFAWADATQALSLPNNGEVRLTGATGLPNLHVSYRQGGETMQVQGRGRRDLKRLLNESGFPAFARERLPLLWSGDQLVAVANLAGLCRLAESDVQFSWHWNGSSVD